VKIATCIYNLDAKLIEMLKIFVWSAGINTSAEVIEVYHDGLSQEDQDQIKNKVPIVRFIPISTELDFDIELSSQKMNLWNQIVNRTEDGQTLVLMDCDMLICRDLKKVFRKDFNLAFTVKNDSSTLFPLNTGIVFLKMKSSTRSIMDRWYKETCRILGNNDLLEYAVALFGGADQCSLAKILNRRYNFLEPITIGNFRFLGLPASEFNVHKDWSKVVDARVVHYKGTWSDVLVNDAKDYEGALVISGWGKRRDVLDEICSWKPAYDLWKTYQKKFYP
jgi:hypothetical protein